MILTSALEAESFHSTFPYLARLRPDKFRACLRLTRSQPFANASAPVKGIKIINTFVQYAYQGTVIASFIFSMGNKPKA